MGLTHHKIRFIIRLWNKLYPSEEALVKLGKMGSGSKNFAVPKALYTLIYTIYIHTYGAHVECYYDAEKFK